MPVFLDYINGDESSLDEAAARAARRRSARRLQAVLADTLSCQACRQRLAEYAQAQEMASPLAPELQAVAGHLAHCQSCASEYAALQALSRAGEAAALDAAPVPEPDLSFLSPAPSPIANLWRQVQPGSFRLLAGIQVSISRVAAQFAAWPAGLAPRPVAVPVLRNRTAARVAQRLALPAAARDLVFELTVGTVAGRAQATLGIRRAGTQEPLPGIAVTLLNERGQCLQRVDTGPDGLATFNDLPAGRYSLSARTADGQWQLDLVLAESSPQ